MCIPAASWPPPPSLPFSAAAAAFLASMAACSSAVVMWFACLDSPIVGMLAIVRLRYLEPFLLPKLKAP